MADSTSHSKYFQISINNCLILSFGNINNTGDIENRYVEFCTCDIDVSNCTLTVSPPTSQPTVFESCENLTFTVWYRMFAEQVFPSDNSFDWSIVDSTDYDNILLQGASSDDIFDVYGYSGDVYDGSHQYSTHVCGSVGRQSPLCAIFILNNILI